MVRTFLDLKHHHFSKRDLFLIDTFSLTSGRGFSISLAFDQVYPPRLYIRVKRTRIAAKEERGLCTHSNPPLTHIIIANPTAPPTTSTISLRHPLVMGASPVCRPGLPEDVPVAVTPAVPPGVFASPPPAPTTVTAVTTDWLPLGSVLVCTTVLVWED